MLKRGVLPKGYYVLLSNQRQVNMLTYIFWYFFVIDCQSTICQKALT